MDLEFIKGDAFVFRLAFDMDVSAFTFTAYFGTGASPAITTPDSHTVQISITTGSLPDASSWALTWANGDGSGITTVAQGRVNARPRLLLYG